MNLYPLLPDLERRVAQGEARRLTRGPKTISQVLAEASARADAEDEAELAARDPVVWARVYQRPRNLWQRLMSRRW